MLKLQIQYADIMRIAVQQEILRSDYSRYDHQLHGILLVSSRLNCTEVARLSGHGPRTIQYWARRFEESLFARLEETPLPGRPSAIDEDTRRNIGVDLWCSPRESENSHNLLESELLSHHLSVNYGSNLCKRQCRRPFRQL